MDEMAATRSYLEAKRARLQGEIDRLSEGLKAVDWILDDMVSTTAMNGTHPVSPLDGITAEELSGLSLIESLEFMAERNGNEITNKDARTKLIAVGKLDEDVATSKIWEALKRSTRLDNVARGHYQLQPEGSIKTPEMLDSE